MLDSPQLAIDHEDEDDNNYRFAEYEVRATKEPPDAETFRGGVRSSYEFRRVMLAAMKPKRTAE